MDRFELENIVDCYLSRKELIEDKNMPSYFYTGREAIFKSYIAVRTRRIEDFVFDALILKDLEYDDNSPSPEFRFRPVFIPQYYLLGQDQLISYLGFRTSLRKGRLPVNNYLSFLSLYLMEILNGIIESDFDYKYGALIKVYDIYSYKNEIKIIKKKMQSAFEILYIQHMDEINKLKYFNEVPLPIFNKTSLSLDNHIVDDEVLIFSIFAVTYRGDKENKNWKEIMNYSGNCLKFVYLELLSEGNFNLHEYKSIEEFFRFTRSTKIDNTNNGMKAIFPITRAFSYCCESGEHELFKDGVQTSTKLQYTTKQIELINIFIMAICISMQEHKSIPANQNKGTDLLISFAKDLYNHPKEKHLPIKPNIADLTYMYRMIDLAVGHWVNKQSSTAESGSKTPSYNLYDLDINDVDKVRHQSRAIQAKLIIEEEEDKITSTTASSKEVLSKEEVLEEGTFKSFIASLSKCEKAVLTHLISNEITKAASIAFNEGQPLSVVVDNINSISDAHIEDIVIADNEVIDDYRDEIKGLIKD
jgi:hypothetical protein